MLLFRCSTCSAWGWAPPSQPSRIAGYKNAFADPRLTNRPPPEPTALTAEARKADESPALASWVDRRGDLLPKKRGKGWYTPRFGLNDWDLEPTGGGRRRSAGAPRS